MRTGRPSGDEVLRGAVAAARLRAPASYVDHGPRDVRRIALTFDDGPGRLTDALVEVLAAHGARATFNVLGERVPGREALVRRTLAAGNEIASHAERHERLAGRPREAYRQLLRSSAAIRAATGVTPRVFRAPYGAVSPGVVRAARLAGLVTVGWDVDPRDYEAPPADVIHERVASSVRPGSIVLLHDDRRALEQTVVAVERLLATLAGRGLRFVTVCELLGLGPAVPPGASAQPERRSTSSV